MANEARMMSGNPALISNGLQLLILTQVVDDRDPYLSFFVGWINSFAQKFERITVICLKEGQHALPPNVRVYSLGKESGASRWGYVRRFFSLIWSLRREYDAAFVHMNQEYVLLGALLWKMLGKRIYLWRNHHVGGPFTALAVMFSNKVFCTSRFSYTARFRKTTLMPVGVDTTVYKPDASVERKPSSVLFLGRIAPSKRPDLFIGSLATVISRGVEATASIYGSPLPHDARFAERLKEKTREFLLEKQIHFYPGQPHAAGPKIFSGHEIFINLSKSGMYDKTIFEAAACGCLVLAASKDYAAAIGDERCTFAEDGSDLPDKLEGLLKLKAAQRESLQSKLAQLVQENSLEALSSRLVDMIG